jgi:hypothetical protein
MNPESLKKLAGASNINELKKAIEALCLPFGGIKNLRLLPDDYGAEYLCYVELDSPQLYPFMIELLGGSTYGTSVVFRIPFKPTRTRA